MGLLWAPPRREAGAGAEMCISPFQRRGCASARSRGGCGTGHLFFSGLGICGIIR